MKTLLIRLLIMSTVMALNGRSAHAQYPWESASAPVRVLFVDQFYNDTVYDRMYAAGHVDLNGDFATNDNSVLWYENGAWDTLGVFDNSIKSIIRWRDTLVVGGGFHSVNGVATEGIVCYANGQWLPYGLIPDGVVFKLRVVNDELYALGSFVSADGLICNGLAKRQGSQWTNVGTISDPGGPVLVDAIEYDGELIACGVISLNGDPVGSVIRYDGTTWSALGGGIVGNSALTMAVYKGELYVGGSFPIGPNPGQAIMRWNGTEWRNLGIGPQIINGSYQYNYQMEDLEVHDDLLFVCGGFKYASGVPAEFVATYDSLNWCGFTGDFPIGVSPQTIGFYHDTLYFAQTQPVLWGDTVNKILRLIGDTYSDTCGALQVGVGENLRSSGLLIRYSEGEQTVHVDLPVGSSSRPIVLFDALGKIHRRETGIHVAFPCRDLALGVYIVRAEGYAPVPVLVR